MAIPAMSEFTHKLPAKPRGVHKSRSPTVPTFTKRLYASISANAHIDVEASVASTITAQLLTSAYFGLHPALSNNAPTRHRSQRRAWAADAASFAKGRSSVLHRFHRRPWRCINLYITIVSRYAGLDGNAQFDRRFNASRGSAVLPSNATSLPFAA